MAINFNPVVGPTVDELIMRQNQIKQAEQARMMQEWAFKKQQQDAQIAEQKRLKEERARKQLIAATQPSPALPMAQSPILSMVSPTAQVNLIRALQGPNEQGLLKAAADYEFAAGDPMQGAKLQLEQLKLNRPKAKRTVAEILKSVSGPEELYAAEQELKAAGLSDQAWGNIVETVETKLAPKTTMNDTDKYLKMKEAEKGSPLTPAEQIAAVREFKQISFNTQPPSYTNVSGIPGLMVNPRDPTQTVQFPVPPKTEKPDSKPLTGERLDLFLAYRELYPDNPVTMSEFDQALEQAPPGVIKQLREKASASKKNKDEYDQFAVTEATAYGEKVKSSLMNRKEFKMAAATGAAKDRFEALKQQSLSGELGGAAQIDQLYRFLQQLDDSVVRPSEVQLTQNTLSLRSWIDAKFEEYRSGQKNPEVFINSMEKYYRTVMDQMAKRLDKIVDAEFAPYLNLKRIKDSEAAHKFLLDIKDGVRSNYRTIQPPVSGATPMGLEQPQAGQKSGTTTFSFEKPD